MSKLILFDIDKTLLAKAEGHNEAFAVAFQKVYDVHAAIQMINHHGKTDQQIIREVLRLRGVPQEVIEPKISDCMRVMCEYFAAVQEYAHAEAIQGAERTLSEFASRGYLLGLVTGNLEPIAHAKLSAAGLDRFFKLGGFGNEAADRADLVQNAIKKADEQFGLRGEVYLFGDAPQDMKAAAKAGAKPIGVTSGIYSREQLEVAGASRIIASVGDFSGAVEAVRSRPRAAEL